MDNPAQVPGEISHAYERYWYRLAAWLGLSQKKTLKVTNPLKRKDLGLNKQPVGCVWLP